MHDWIEEAASALSRLGPPYRHKKRNTILALVTARLAGQSEETVWSLPETCSRTIYHERWKHDPVFMSVLEEVTRIAYSWQDKRMLRALREASERLSFAAPVAAAKLIALLDSDEPSVVLRAATTILDRTVDVRNQAQPSNLEITVRWGDEEQNDDADG